MDKTLDIWLNFQDFAAKVAEDKKVLLLKVDGLRNGKDEKIYEIILMGTGNTRRYTSNDICEVLRLAMDDYEVNRII